MSNSSPTIKICLGGSFDPVHQGHLQMAQYVADYFGTCVSLVPNKEPPHKKVLTENSHHRYRMLQLACADMPRLKVDDTELKRDGLSYTLDTLKYMREYIGMSVPLIWCVGEDAFAKVNTWYGWHHLLDWAHLLIINRPHLKYISSSQVKNFRQKYHVAEPKQLLSSPKGSIASIKINPVNVSATAIRHSLSKDMVLTNHVLPEPVLTYIKQHHLYSI